ncbi:Monogalactosyldiacylglycerol synthase family GT28 [Gracilaria domingensis]|nr:Monogalactosyldiacylglycerol synthase family GT28 [Gracilaria domingensis]
MAVAPLSTDSRARAQPLAHAQPRAHGGAPPPALPFIPARCFAAAATAPPSLPPAHDDLADHGAAPAAARAPTAQPLAQAARARPVVRHGRRPSRVGRRAARRLGAPARGAGAGGRARLLGADGRGSLSPLPEAVHLPGEAPAHVEVHVRGHAFSPVPSRHGVLLQHAGAQQRARRLCQLSAGSRRVGASAGQYARASRAQQPRRRYVYSAPAIRHRRHRPGRRPPHLVQSQRRHGVRAHPGRRSFGAACRRGGRERHHHWLARARAVLEQGAPKSAASPKVAHAPGRTGGAGGRRWRWCGRSQSHCHRAGSTVAAEDERPTGSARGYVTNMSEWMAASDIICTKAGPGTIAESLIRGLPIIVTAFLPGQEEANVRYVEEQKVGVFAQRPNKIASIAAEWLSEPQLLREMSERAVRCGRPDATMQIAEDIVRVARHKITENINVMERRRQLREASAAMARSNLRRYLPDMPVLKDDSKQSHLLLRVRFLLRVVTASLIAHRALSPSRTPPSSPGGKAANPRIADAMWED